jgi:hypothetical protein
MKSSVPLGHRNTLGTGLTPSEMFASDGAPRYLSFTSTVA